MSTKNELDAHAIDDDLAPRTPIDGVARRVVAPGVHFAGFGNRSEELCSPLPLPTRPYPNAKDMTDFTGRSFGRLTVVGLATKENNGDGYTRIDRLSVIKRRVSPNYKGADPDPHRGKKAIEPGTRWVCRCVCGMFTLRATKAIRRALAMADNDDSCYQCYQLARQRVRQANPDAAAAREARLQYKALREKFGVVCPKCKKLRPKSPGSILLPGQVCNDDGFQDPRPALE